MARRGRAGLRRSGVLGVLTAAALVACTGIVAAVPPPPPNPSEHDVDKGRARVHHRAGDVGRITTKLSDAESELSDLQSKVELKMERANKALVDVRSAKQAAGSAQQAARSARGQAEAANTRVRKARADVDQFAENSYKQGSTVGSMSAYIGSKNPEEFLQRKSLLNAVSNAKLNAMDAMQRARTDATNKESTARAALHTAQRKKRAAERSKSAADDAKAAAVSARQNQQHKTRSITAKKKRLEHRLNAAQAKVGGLTAARKRYNKWLAAKKTEQQQAAAAASAAKSGGGGHATTQTTTSGSGSARTVINRAKSALGTRYSWGGGTASGPTVGIHDGGVADSFGDYMHSGFDCSGLMVYAFAAAGVSLPHYSGYQYTAGKHVPMSQIRPGDMVFYGTSGIHHVALYLGNGQMLEAPQSGMKVRITPLRHGDSLPYATRML